MSKPNSRPAASEKPSATAKRWNQAVVSRFHAAARWTAGQAAFLVNAVRSAWPKIIAAWRDKMSPPRLTLRPAAWGLPAMVASSAAVIALETVLFHLLQIVTDYLTAASLIGMAMFGIALGGLVSFLCARWNLLATTVLAAALLFFSIIFSYAAVINVGALDFPWPLILPFFTASWIISNVYAAGLNANLLNFANSVGSGLGVLIPLFLVPVLKSETLMIVLLLIPCLLLLLTALRVRHLVFKGALSVVALGAAILVWNAAAGNRSLPERIGAETFEKKILPAVAGFYEEKTAVNRNWEFMRSVYKKEGDEYRFTGDEEDRRRARNLFACLGFRHRFPLPIPPLRGDPPDLSDLLVIPAALFEGDLERAFALRFRTVLEGNPDREFLARVYRPEAGDYILTGSAYEKARAKHLLGELGFFPFYDLNLDVRRHGLLRDLGKMYNGAERVLLSEDDLLGRLEYTGDETLQAMAVNGVYLDSLDRYNGAHWDPRVPRVDFLDRPKVFIIGLSADGIVKSTKRLPGAVVAGCELHPVVMRTMTEDGLFARLANRPYDNVEVHQAEGRSFLESDPRRWDMIALMNIHPEHGPLNTVAPENLHTRESVRLLLDRLTDRGMIVYEEIVTNTRSELAFRKFLSTCRAALAGPGGPDPARCFYLFRWDFWGEGGTFRTLILRRAPFSYEELRQLDVFYRAVEERYPGTALLHRPDLNLGTAYEAVIRGAAPLQEERLPALVAASDFNDRLIASCRDPRDREFLLSRYYWNGRSWALKEAGLSSTDRARLAGLFRMTGLPLTVDLAPVTDDKPFPYAVWEEKTEVRVILDRALLMALILCLPVVVLFLRGLGAPARVLLPAVLFTALSGFAYMLVEIILLQRFQLFIGNPASTLAVILGGMLFSSGLGSLVGRFLPRRLVAAASASIPILLFLYLVLLDGWLLLFAGAGQESKLIVSALTVFPLSFLMGMPFPAAMEMVKTKAEPAFTALLFGISGGAATVASAAALYINVESGFTASFMLGMALYALGGGFFFLLLFLTRSRAAA